MWHFSITHIGFKNKYIYVYMYIKSVYIIMIMLLLKMVFNLINAITLKLLQLLTYFLVLFLSLNLRLYVDRIMLENAESTSVFWITYVFKDLYWQIIVCCTKKHGLNFNYGKKF